MSERVAFSSSWFDGLLTGIGMVSTAWAMVLGATTLAAVGFVAVGLLLALHLYLPEPEVGHA